MFIYLLLIFQGNSGSSGSPLVPTNPSPAAKKKVPPPPPRRTCSLDRNPSNASAATRSNRDSVVTVIDVSVDAPSLSLSEDTDKACESVTNEESSMDAGPESLELSDFDAPERVDEFKLKTTITSGRIPSMCAITPTPLIVMMRI